MNWKESNLKTLDDQNHHSVIPSYDAETLTEGGAMAQIVLNEQTYNLRITRAGKLILTK
ncbi:hemin uptake protein HemP [Roseovarius sp.]|uniref:hemin uptake protein HemP n=1 Tax=Roseovarius sp. TaxID=1486281 RepID=UPI0026196FC3|nr:hemin uptake protein HemP [Roseovarius sp.]